MGREGHWRGERGREIARTFLYAGTIAVFILLLSFAASSQNQQQLPDSPKAQNNAPQSLPEGPRPQNNSPQAPNTTNQPSQPPLRPNEPAPGTPQEPANPGTEPQTDSGAPAETETPSRTSPEPAPNPQVTTVPPGSAGNTADTATRDQLPVFTHHVNAVTVPVTVKDGGGHLVEGLLAKDFAVYEDGERQKVTFFLSDPFPLSAAVVIDMGMPDNVLSKVRNTLPALVGAFGQFDEISIFSYGNTVKKWQDFVAVNKVTPAIMKQLKAQRGGASGAPVVGGPLGQSGPVINGRNAADNTPNIPSMPTTTVHESHVLNDAVLAAARDLSRRDGALRRRIVFVVSDGREVGSDASYADVMKVLLSNGITVYGVGVGGAGIPGYRTLEKIRVPGSGYGNILPKYASATGGQVFSEFDEKAIETAYSQMTEEARNQYTIGYQTRATPSTAYRSIEVRVNRSGLRVYAKDGYYPLPPRRPAPMTNPTPTSAPTSQP